MIHNPVVLFYGQFGIFIDEDYPFKYDPDLFHEEELYSKS